MRLQLWPPGPAPASSRSRFGLPGSALALAGLAILAFPSLLPAQPRGENRREVSFTAGASLGDGGAALASTAGIAFRLTARVGVAAELAHARKLDFTLDLCPPPLVCVRGGRLPVTGRTLSLVPHVTIDLVPATHRLRAYVVAGLGAGHVRQRYFDHALAPGERREFTRSSLTAAVSFGGGATFALSRRLAWGADVRSLHLFDDEALPERFITPAEVLDTVRIGSRVVWRF